MKLIHILAILLTILMNGCGGGTGSNNETPTNPPPPTYFGGVHYGYFITVPEQLDAVKGHTDVIMLPQYGFKMGSHTYTEDFRKAHANGLKVILEVNQFMYKQGICKFDPFNLQAFMDDLKSQGWLTDIIGFYPLDEPDLNSNETEVISCNTQLRSFLTQHYPELAQSKFLVIYYQAWPGIQTYDWIGTSICKDCDFVADVPLTSSQQLILIPYGANPWHKHPQKAVDYAKTHGNVALVMPFLYDGWGPDGIRNNGLRTEYCEAGKTLTLKQTTCN